MHKRRVNRVIMGRGGCGDGMGRALMPHIIRFTVVYVSKHVLEKVQAV